MTNEASQLLQLTRFQSRKGDLRDAQSSAAQGLLLLATGDDPSSWIEFARIYINACIELEELEKIAPFLHELITFLKRPSQTEYHQASAETLIASCLLAQRKLEEFDFYINSAIYKATQSRDMDTLARALLVKAFQLSFDPAGFTQSLQYLEKIEILLQSLSNPEVSYTAKTIRGYIHIEQGLYDQALDILWLNYEQAKLHGFVLSISGVLAQIARVFRLKNQDSHYKLYAELAIKGLDPQKSPRLYKSILAALPEGISDMQIKFDLQIDEENHFMRERNKGYIDFKNQHILFDLAMLFSKSPGIRFSKKTLADNIWNQVYDPGLHDNLIYVSIKRLRTLLEPDLESPRYILRDRKGYYLNPQALIQMRKSGEATR